MAGYVLLVGGQRLGRACARSTARRRPCYDSRCRGRALPFGVAGIGVGELLDDGVTLLAISGERLLVFSLIQQQVADPARG